MQKHFVFFDFDGTLVDTSPGIINAVCYALEQYGISVSDRATLHPFIGPPLTDSFARYYHFTDEQIAASVKNFRKYYGETGIHESAPYPGIADVLRTVRDAGFPCVVTSSKPEEYLMHLLERFGILGYFDCVIGATMSGSRIRKEEIIRLAMTRNGVNPGEAIVVGDHPLDILGAHACGLASCAVLYGFGKNDELAAAQPDFTAERLEDIPAAIRQWHANAN